MIKVNIRILTIVICMWFLVQGVSAKVAQKEGYIEYMGGKTWYKIVGSGHGIPLIAIHGGPGFPHYYLEPLELLADERPVIFYDQRGCGKSDPLTDTSLMTIEFFVGELKALIKQLNLKRYHIMGQSWGTMISCDFALTQPKGLKSMVFSGPCLSALFWEQDQREHIKALPQDMQEAIYFSEATGDYSTPEYQAAIMEFYNRYVCRINPWPESLMKSMNEINMQIYGYMWGPSEFTALGTLKDYDRTYQLHMIEYPTLLTCGSWDEADPKTVKYYKNLMPNACMKIFYNASHEHHLEQPKEYIKTVRIFLHKVEHHKPIGH